MAGPTDPSSWLGAAVTALCAIVAAAWVLVRRLLNSVTREELAEILEKLEDRHNDTIEKLEERHQQKIEELRSTVMAVHQTLMAFHEDNRDARHRLRDDLTGPINKIYAELAQIRSQMGDT